MRKIGNILQASTSVVSAILLLVLTISVFLQIMSREILRVSWTWSDESARYSFIWCALLSSSILVRKKRHFEVSILKEWIKKPGFLRFIEVFCALCTLFVCGCIFYYGIQFAQMGFKKIAPTTQMRMVWVYSAIPVSASLMVFYSVEALLDIFGVIPHMSAEEMDEISLWGLIRRKKGGA
ncbi:MAG: TRAP transporter small permease [Clostridia bacterium]|nr:TRAP transporter small permease [Clostridia bacterium]